jgi:hypothetical protein
MTQDKELRTKDGKIVIPEGMTIIFDESPTAFKDLESVRAAIRQIAGVKQVLFRYKEEPK